MYMETHFRFFILQVIRKISQYEKPLQYEKPRSPIHPVGSGDLLAISFQPRIYVIDPHITPMGFSIK